MRRIDLQLTLLYYRVMRQRIYKALAVMVAAARIAK